MLAKGNRSQEVTDACQRARRLLPRLDRRPGGAARQGLHHEGRGARVSRARHGSGVEDRGRRLPRVHRRRRQGQRLLRRGVEARLRSADAAPARSHLGLELGRQIGDIADTVDDRVARRTTWVPTVAPDLELGDRRVAHGRLRQPVVVGADAVRPPQRGVEDTGVRAREDSPVAVPVDQRLERARTRAGSLRASRLPRTRPAPSTARGPDARR